MKNPGSDPREIQVGSTPKGVGAASMKKGTPTMALFGHDIGIRSRGLGSGREVPDVDTMASAILENLLAKVVLANHAGGQQWKRHS